MKKPSVMLRVTGVFLIVFGQEWKSLEQSNTLYQALPTQAIHQQLVESVPFPDMISSDSILKMKKLVICYILSNSKRRKNSCVSEVVS